MIADSNRRSSKGGLHFFGKPDKSVQTVLSDVGLLAAMYMDGIQIKILNGEKSINFGAVYENVVAQELKAHGFE